MSAVDGPRSTPLTARICWLCDAMQCLPRHAAGTAPSVVRSLDRQARLVLALGSQRVRRAANQLHLREINMSTGLNETEII